MKESDVLTRLGLKDKDELVSLIENSGLNERLFRLASVDRETHSIKLEFCESGCYFKIVQGDVRDISEVTEESTNVHRKGWSCILESSTEEINFKKTPKPIGFPKSNCRVEMDKVKVWYFHKGHILGRGVSKYVSRCCYFSNDSEENFGGLNRELIDNINTNLFTQFASANYQIGSSTRKSQAYFEREVENFFKASENGVIFYEVKAIYKKSEDSIDKYPIGTEIFYTTLGNNSREESIEQHVFIPNCDVYFDLSGLGVSYKQFYKHGYDEIFQE